MVHGSSGPVDLVLHAGERQSAKQLGEQLLPYAQEQNDAGQILGVAHGIESESVVALAGTSRRRPPMLGNRLRNLYRGVQLS